MDLFKLIVYICIYARLNGTYRQDNCRLKLVRGNTRHVRVELDDKLLYTQRVYQQYPTVLVRSILDGSYCTVECS